MNYSFEYIDIILLAMIAGFIFLRLRGILGKRTGHKESVDSSFPHDFLAEKKLKNKLDKIIFDEKAKEDFLKGAKIAYETIITNFASGNLKGIKYLLDKKVFDQFNEALEERENKGYISETTFVGIDSALIKEHNKANNILQVTVDFVSEIISCVKDKDNKILSGDPEKVKKVFDTWKFKKDSRSNNPNWLLIDTQI
jgi:predicted lipid-binding transport protein (Tim44 family)